MRTVGELIYQQRELLGLTLAQVAKRSGIAKSYLSMIENHRVANPPSSSALAALAQALALELSVLEEAAAWERAPQSVLAEVEKLSERARRGRELAEWLNQVTPKRNGLRQLDQLYRSGALRKKINAALPAEDEVSPTPMNQRVPLINKVAAGYPTDFTDLGYPVRIADEYVSASGIDDPDAFAATVTGDSMEPTYQESDIVIFSPLAAVTEGCDCFVRLEPNHETTFKRVFMDESNQTIRLQPMNPKFPPQILKRTEVAGMYRAVMRISHL